jgi:hypothetical protein
MGTFHQHRGELHGITIVVTMRDGSMVAGRCNTADDQAVVLWDADIAPPDADGRAKWLAKAAEYGVWAKHPTLTIRGGDVLEIRRLIDVAP